LPSLAERATLSSGTPLDPRRWSGRKLTFVLGVVGFALASGLGGPTQAPATDGAPVHIG
jgi:hypothetical protein